MHSLGKIIPFDTYRHLHRVSRETATHTRKQMMNLYVKPHAQHITPLVPALGTKTLNQLEKPLLQAQKIVVGVHNATRILDVAALFGEPRPNQQFKQLALLKTFKIFCTTKNPQLKHIILNAPTMTTLQQKKNQSPLITNALLLHNSIAGPFMRGGNLLTPDSVYVAPYKKKHLKLPDWPQGRKKLQKEQNHWIIGDLETISWQKR